jgi:hypothetical protein
MASMGKVLSPFQDTGTQDMVETATWASLDAASGRDSRGHHNQHPILADHNSSSHSSRGGKSKVHPSPGASDAQSLAWRGASGSRTLLLLSIGPPC